VKSNRTDEDRYRADCSRDRRIVLKAHGLCICGPGPGQGFTSRNGVVHGPVVSGGRCQRCIDLKKGKAS
jgi:hypothetical protein